MKKIFIILVGLIGLILTEDLAQAQTQRIWTGIAGDFNWSNPSNWQNNVVPGSSDIAVFDNTGVGNCNINNPTIVYGLNVSSGYTGTITQSVGLQFYIGPFGMVLNGGLIIINDNCLIWGVFDIEGGSLDDEQGFMFSPVDTETYTQAVAEFCISGLPLTENQNYVRTQLMLVPVQQEMQTIALTPGSQLVQTEYFDGLGRSIETVAWQASPLYHDMVQIKEYDDHGLQIKKYLPFTAQECNGQFKAMNNSLRQDNVSNTANNAFLTQMNFYTSNTDPLIAKTSIPSTYAPATYAESVYDNSPLHRIYEQGSAGDTWRVQAGGIGNTRQINRRTNIANEVLFWTYDQTTENATTLQVNQTVSYYPQGTLSVIEYLDENKNKTTLYNDKLGRLLLKVSPKTGGSLFTYYVYDDFNQLRYVIPPLALSLTNIDGSRTFNDASYAGYQLLYAYRYDARHRNIENKLPGASSSKVIFDYLDRPVMVQDGNQISEGNWNFIKYDKLNRIILTGVYTDNAKSTAATWQSNVNGQSILSESRTNMNTTEWYSNNVIPIITDNHNILRVNYYDDYDFNNDGNLDYSYHNTTVLGMDEPIPFYNNGGQDTGKKVRNLSNMDWLIDVGFYDKHARGIQLQSNNHLYLSANPGSTVLSDIKTVVYDFAGRLLNTLQVHTPGGSLASVTVRNQMTYDHRSRLKNIFQQLNNEPAVLLSTVNYNELGQPIEKNLHSEDQGLHYLQSIDFRYNIRGWLQTINNSSLTNDFNIGGAYTNNDNNDLFGMQLLYDQVELSVPANGVALNTPMYDGQISAVKWKTNNAGGTNSNERMYTYSYDKNYRLTGSFYTERNAGTWGSLGNKYTEQGITYDDGGNIQTLNRYDQSGAAIDQLSYNYNGNKLSKVLDQYINYNIGFLSSPSAQAQSTQYTYDTNGNLIDDDNKQIQFSYNYLNLIDQIEGSAFIRYVYDATGTMLSKIVTSPSGHALVTDYVDGFLYVGGILEYVATAEGRAEWNGTAFRYVYDLKDYHGNSRISFDKDPQSTPAIPIARVIQEDHFYPYGMSHGNPSVYNFGSHNDFMYAGKEIESVSNLYDFGARMYDPALGRWHVIDPLADNSKELTPYNFVMNNPINVVDPTGLDADVDKAILLGVIVVASIITDGLADEFGGVIAESLAKAGIEDKALTEDLGGFFASNAIASSAAVTGAALVSDQKFGTAGYWKDVAIGWLAGSAAAGADPAVDEAGTSASFSENVLIGTEKGALTGFITGNTTGMLNSLIEDPLHPANALKMGLTEGLTGAAIGGVAGGAGGSIRGLRGSNLLVEDEEIQANISQKGWINTILQDDSHSLGRLFNAYYYKGNFGGTVVEEVFDPLIEKLIGDPLHEVFDLHLDRIINKLLDVREP